MFSKQIFISIASVISVVAYIPYIVDIFKNKTKPHVISWFIWSAMSGIAFFSQIVGGAGIGSFLLGFTTVMCFLIALLSIKKGTKDVEFVDWLTAAGSVSALVFWVLTKTPYLSVMIITVSDFLATFPTIRKTYKNPYQETSSFYLLNTAKYFFGVMALEKYSLITTLYPAYLLVINGVVFILIYLRKLQLKSQGLNEI